MLREMRPDVDDEIVEALHYEIAEAVDGKAFDLHPEEPHLLIRAFVEGENGSDGAGSDCVREGEAVLVVRCGTAKRRFAVRLYEIE